MLFSDRSLWTMMHGIVLAGGALLALAAALFAMTAMTPTHDPESTGDSQSRALAWLTAFIAVMLWATVLSGTYVIFPAYRATRPQGVVDLAGYPRSLLVSNPGTAWLHTFGMESKEHMPWIASMLATAIAFVGVRDRANLSRDRQLRIIVTTLLAICFALVAFTGLMGIFINKVAPLE